MHFVVVELNGAAQWELASSVTDDSVQVPARNEGRRVFPGDFTSGVIVSNLRRGIFYYFNVSGARN